MPPTRSLPRIAVAARDAAAMLGMSETKFEEHVAAGLFPPPRQIGRRILWSVAELDAAFHALPVRGQDMEVNPWDAV